jgi:hypothetical protein
VDFQVVAHEVQLVSGGTIGRVHSQLRSRQLEDQPASACVDMRLSEDVGEEGAIRFRITAEDDDVAAKDHEADPTRRNGTAVVDGDDAPDADERLLNPPDGSMTSLAVSSINRSSVGMRTIQSGDSCSSCSASRHVLSRCAPCRRRR